MDTEDWVFKGTKLITNTKKAKIKNLEKLDFQKYNIKEKTKKKRKKQSHKNDFKKYIYEVCFKNRVFF